jgi:Tol biopolymer transport system component
MTKPSRSLLAGVVMAFTLTMVGNGQTTAAGLFQEGLMLERAEGNLREAAARYERVVSEFPHDRQVVAKALLQLGGVHEKLKRPDARSTYERILRDFPDVGTVAADARARLAVLPVPPAARPEGVTSKKLLSGPGADRYGSVSRDGRFLSFMGTNGDLAIRDLTTGEVRRITNNPAGSKEFAEYSVFSPDGSQLAYGWYNARGEYELRVIGRDGGEPRRLYAQEGVRWVAPYDWSPDGREILAILPREDRTRQLILVSAADGSVRVLKTLEWNMGVPSKASFSPDGRTIVYDRQRSEQNSDRDVFLLAVDGTREAAVASGPGEDSFLGWFPDGKAVLFSSDRSGTPGAWMVGIDDRGPIGEPRLLNSDIGRLHSKGFSRDGDFFYHKDVGGPDVYLVDSKPTGRITRAPRPLGGRSANGRIWATWSPDGERLVYAGMGPRPAVAVHDVRTAVVSSVPLQMNYLGALQSTSSGLLVTGADSHARWGIYRVDLATGAVDAVVAGEYGVNPRFSRDGKFLFYSPLEEKPQALIVRNMEGGEVRELFRGDFAHAFALSPDGHSVAVRMLTEGERGVHVIRVADGTSRLVFPLSPEDTGRGLAWTADGTALLVVHGKENSELWRVPVGGGQPEPLDLKLPGMRTVSVSPDGRRLAIVASDITSEVWVLQNVGAARDAR